MSKDITEKILLKAVFHKMHKEGSSYGSCDLITKDNEEISICYDCYPIISEQKYRCWVYTEDVEAIHEYISTIEDFNMLMELMDIRFKLKEYNYK